MAAYAKVELNADSKFHGTEYKKGDVLRLDSETARRLLRKGQVKPYDGQKRPANETEEAKQATAAKAPRNAPKRAQKAVEPEVANTAKETA